MTNDIIHATSQEAGNFVGGELVLGTWYVVKGMFKLNQLFWSLFIGNFYRPITDKPYPQTKKADLGMIIVLLKSA